MKTLVVMAFALVPTIALSQPYSQSMADCAAIYRNAAQSVHSDANVDDLMGVSQRWSEASVIQARAEGLVDPQDTMHAIIDSKTKDWEAKGKAVFLTEEFRDWTKYCRSFAKHVGVDVTR
ncbi:hypothetical protein [Roseovarius sp. 2305UL8-3]|uniref:hypothetical protein n=1 Tax=Roseovarius conchicola TaxID=3121636 RepID=UPI003527827C